MNNSFADFIQCYQNSSDERWLQGLIEKGWTAFDWPLQYGGTDWTRSQKLSFISVICEAGCPLLPDAVTVIAPLLLKLGTEEQKKRFLPGLRQDPDCCSLITRKDDGDNSTLYLSEKESQEMEVLGQQGQAVAHLATCTSPLFEIQGLKTTLRLIGELNQHWSDTAQTDLSELEVTLAALEAMYLLDEERQDLLIAIKTNQVRLDSLAMLFQSLGYYALLDPDPLLTGNEFLPFVKEREHLRRLRMSVHRSEMLQQDLLYKNYLEEAK